jgi:hypothetical protein
MKVQLSRLFGEQSKIAITDFRSDAAWRRDLRTVLSEIWNYFDANVETDSVHRVMLETGFDAAGMGLSQENFWPSYAEGLTRIVLCLLGSYPDHRKRKSGGKKKDHYKLDSDRSLRFVQTHEQRLHMLFWSASALLQLRSEPLNTIHEFREEVGLEVPFSQFLDWFKQKYPDDYLKVF